MPDKNDKVGLDIDEVIKNSDAFNEELLKRIEQAAHDGAKRNTFKEKWLPYIVLIIIIIALILGGGLYIKKTINNGWSSFKDQFAIASSAEDHDLVLDNDGIRGYTAADFSKAILEKEQQEKKLTVYEMKLSDAVVITDTGLFNIGVFSKYQALKFTGTAEYYVDLSNINEKSIKVDEKNKTITLYIPHPQREELGLSDKDIEVLDEKKGFLAIGEVKYTIDDFKLLKAEVEKRMISLLDELDTQTKADRIATMMVWEIYQPVVTSVSPEYKLVVDFNK